MTSHMVFSFKLYWCNIHHASVGVSCTITHFLLRSDRSTSIECARLTGVVNRRVYNSSDTRSLECCFFDCVLHCVGPEQETQPEATGSCVWRERELECCCKKLGVLCALWVNTVVHLALLSDRVINTVDNAAVMQYTLWRNTTASYCTSPSGCCHCNTYWPIATTIVI